MINFALKLKVGIKVFIKQIYKLKILTRDPKFNEILLKIREGIIDDEITSTLQTRLIKPPEDSLIKPSVLYSKNIDVSGFNMLEYQKLY